MTSDLNVSLEDHLLDVLKPLVPLLPPEDAQKLSNCLHSPLIPYSLLSNISRWSRTDSGKTALKSHSLDHKDYMMVSLLAGTTTSPERKFGAYIPPKEPEEVAAESRRERKILTSIINGLFSIAGSGAAAWWASDKTGWRDEWRALFSLFVAMVVAAAESVLYLIWTSRAAKSQQKSARRRRLASARHKKFDDKDHALDMAITDEGARNVDGLRQRTTY